MAYLVVNGHTVNVEADSGKQAAPVRIGSSSRAFAGNLRSTVRAEKRSWTFTTRWITVAESQTLLGDLALGAFVNCYGDALYGSSSGSPISCQGTITDVADGTKGSADGTGVLRKVSFTLAEV